MKERKREDGKACRRLGLLPVLMTVMSVFTYQCKTISKDGGVKVSITLTLFEAKIAMEYSK